MTPDDRPTPRRSPTDDRNTAIQDLIGIQAEIDRLLRLLDLAATV